jgi:hypothetical protein
MPKKWEYCVIVVAIDALAEPRISSLQNDLKLMGDEGWELVTVAPRTVPVNDGLPFAAIFKRPRSVW